MRASMGESCPDVPDASVEASPFAPPALPTHPLNDGPQDLVAQQLPPPLRLVLDVCPHIAGGLDQHQLLKVERGGVGFSVI